LGWAGSDQSLIEVTDRFGPWLSGALLMLLATGIVMVVGEPARELLAFSFWLKMSLIATGTAVVAAFRITLRKNGHYWENPSGRWGMKSLALLTLLIWLGVVILGRLIA